MKKLYVLCILLLTLSCSKDDGEIQQLSTAKDMLSFAFTIEGNTYSGTISNTTVSVLLPEDTEVTTLTPTITVSKGATVSPNSGVAQDFSKVVTYTVTAENKSTQVYTVSVTTEKSEQPDEPIKITFDEREYLNKAGGEVIFFDVNTLPVKKEQIKVKLHRYRDALSYDLKVQKIDKKERRVYVVLPESYKNGQYHFRATFDKEEVDSGAFSLDNGEMELQVLDVIMFEPVTSLATIEAQTFKTVINANAEALEKYTYYLRKNGQDYPLTVKNISGYNLEFKMFNTPAGAFSGGNDFKFVVKGGAKEQVLDFVNSNKQAIKIEPVYAPVIKTLSATKLRTDDELIVTGENFAYSGMNYIRDYRFCNLLLMQDGEIKATLYSNHRTATEAKFKIGEEVPSGTYKVVFSSQVKLKSEVFAQEITVQQLTAGRLTVNLAKIVNKNAASNAKFVQIYFNEELNNATIKAIVFPKLKIEKIIPFPQYKVISSAQILSDNDYDYLVDNLPLKGYVLIEEDGKEYKADFSLVMRQS
ncbi:hypothetical protein RCZ04_09420 [Capnocytophaga sp. HP1101]